MSANEEDNKRAAELKQWIETRIASLQVEINRLQEILPFIDTVLRKSSFKPASEIAVQPTKQTVRISPNSSPGIKEVQSLKRSKDGFLFANAYISIDVLTIVPASDVKLSIGTPPFHAFFLNRVLEGMKNKDIESVASGVLPKENVLSYEVVDENGLIKKIDVRNFGNKNRLREILSTATWAFTRMLEKKS